MLGFRSVRSLVTSLAGVTSIALVLSACSSTPNAAGADGAVPDGGAPVVDAGLDSADLPPLGGDRPVAMHVPPTYKEGVAAPLVILLHGYGVGGLLEEIYMGLNPVSDARGFLYAYPDGLVDSSGKRFWNATDACCNFGNVAVDDSKYLSTLITQIQARYSVDPKRIFLLGHSNGGFMSYRMACEHADQIAAIASLAGAMWSDTSKCKPANPVSVLQIHGTEDATIDYKGSAIEGKTYPGAEATVSSWATLDGCGTTPDTSSPAIDIETKLAGAETKVTKYSGCKPGGHAELWTIEKGSHIPTVGPGFGNAVVDFFYAHPKP